MARLSMLTCLAHPIMVGVMPPYAVVVPDAAPAVLLLPPPLLLLLPPWPWIRNHWSLPQYPLGGEDLLCHPLPPRQPKTGAPAAGVELSGYGRLSGTGVVLSGRVEGLARSLRHPEATPPPRALFLSPPPLLSDVSLVLSLPPDPAEPRVSDDIISIVEKPRPLPTKPPTLKLPLSPFSDLARDPSSDDMGAEAAEFALPPAFTTRCRRRRTADEGTLDELRTIATRGCARKRRGICNRPNLAAVPP